MKELQEKIELTKKNGSWDGVDVDAYMDEVRGRIPEWCGYPKELHCMSLARGYVNGEDFCKTCDAYKWQKK